MEDDDRSRRRKGNRRGVGPVSRKSAAVIFLIGAIFLAVPLVLVAFWSSAECRSISSFVFSTTVKSFCPSTALYDQAIPLLPYPMVFGGLLIGFNMKRISDSLLPTDDEEEEEKEGEEGEESSGIFHS